MANRTDVSPAIWDGEVAIGENARVTAESSSREAYAQQRRQEEYRGGARGISPPGTPDHGLRHFQAFSGKRDIELLLMDCRIALDRDHSAKVGLNLVEDVTLRTPQGLCHLRIDPQNDFVMSIDAL